VIVTGPFVDPGNVSLATPAALVFALWPLAVTVTVSLNPTIAPFQALDRARPICMRGRRRPRLCCSGTNPSTLTAIPTTVEPPGKRACRPPANVLCETGGTARADTKARLEASGAGDLVFATSGHALPSCASDTALAALAAGRRSAGSLCHEHACEERVRCPTREGRGDTQRKCPSEGKLRFDSRSNSCISCADHEAAPRNSDRGRGGAAR